MKILSIVKNVGQVSTMKVTKDFIYIPLTRKQAEFMGAVWNNKEKMYRLPNTLGVLNELEEIYPQLAEYKTKKLSQRNKLLRLKTLDDVEGDNRLRPYQRVDVNYLKHIGSAGIFNEQRTGKTPTTLVLTKEKGFEKTVIVAPASLLINWKEEVERWTGKKALISTGLSKKRKDIYHRFSENNYSYLVVSYETLRNDIDVVIKVICPFDCLIVDEAHRLRSLINGKRASQISKAVVKLGKHAKTRYALTGTPTVKEGNEIWGILHFLYPDRFPGYWQFIDRYFEKEFNGFGTEINGYKRKRELQDILAVISTNRKRSEVMQWLPPKHYQTIKLEMNNKQKKAYESVRDTFEYEDLIDAPSVLAQLTRLRQLTTCPSILVPEIKNEKEKFIMEWLEDNPNESVIIFSTFSSYLKQLQKKIKGSRLITGEINQKQRDEAVKAFQAGKVRVILANIKAAGTGLTLDKAETVIFLDKEYNPSDNEQAEDRIVPTVKERNHSMTVISLIMKNTVDEMIHHLLEQKIDITKVINNGGIEALERMWRNVGEN